MHFSCHGYNVVAHVLLPQCMWITAATIRFKMNYVYMIEEKRYKLKLFILVRLHMLLYEKRIFPCDLTNVDMSLVCCEVLFHRLLWQARGQVSGVKVITKASYT